MPDDFWVKQKAEMKTAYNAGDFTTKTRRHEACSADFFNYGIRGRHGKGKVEGVSAPRCGGGLVLWQREQDAPGTMGRHDLFRWRAACWPGVAGPSRWGRR